MIFTNRKKKVVLAMSGGVDSSIAAMLLKREGFFVQGVFFDFFKDNQALKDVKNTAKDLGIPLKIIDASLIFKKKVIDYFIDELKKGNTPNPCVVCNKEIKFALLFNELKKIKADFVATGHYSRIIKNEKCKGEPEFSLVEAIDKNKDQSYFLHKLNQKELSKIIFPLGNYKKTQIRKIAKESGLSVYEKKESQDICFVPQGKYENFLAEMLRLKQGKICNSKGKILGIHQGLPLYTIGQRKGIKIGGNGPYYVLKKDSKKNMLTVTNKIEEIEILGKEIRLKGVNWTGKEPKMLSRIFLRTRYRNPLVCGIIKKYSQSDSADKEYLIILEKPQRAVTPGQFAVFYSKKGEVSGGGTIV